MNTSEIVVPYDLKIRLSYIGKIVDLYNQVAIGIPLGLDDALMTTL